MKIAAIFIGLLVIAASAECRRKPVKVVDREPVPKDKNLVVDLINVLFKVLQDTMKKNDPFELPEFERETTLFQMLKVGVSIKDFRLSGFSDIALDQLEYEDSLRFDISLPKLNLCADKARAFAGSAVVEAGGRLSLAEAGISGDIDFGFSRKGITLNKLQIRLRLEKVEADLKANILGNDFSDIANNFLNNKLVTFLEENNEKISNLIELLGTMLVDIVSNILFYRH